jgi:hypothetical protein
MDKSESASELIESTIYDLRIDAAYLRCRSREVVNQTDAERLRDAAEAISRLSTRLERVAAKSL